MRARAVITGVFLVAFLLAIPPAPAPAQDTTLAIIPKRSPEQQPPPEQEEPPAEETQPAQEEPPALEPPPTEQAPPAPAPPARQATQYIVRTRPFLSVDDLKPLKEALEEAGYYPHVQEEKIEGEEDNIHYIEMGSFLDLKSALPLFKALRAAGLPVFLYSLSEPAPPQDAPILPPALAGQFFPEMREADVDRLELVMEIADARRPAQPPPPAVATPTTEPGAGPVFVTQPPHRAVQPIESTIRRRLRDMAWSMREKGYGVFLQGETELTPEGILVGVFDTEEDAADLAGELGSYGYTMRVLRETYGGTRYYVYVDTGDAVPPARTTTGEPSEAPPEGDPFDYLLDMTLPR